MSPAPTQEDPADSPADDGPSAPGWLRPVLTLGLLAGLAYLTHLSGLLETVDAAWVRDTVESAGAWGILAFTGIFTVGELVHVPGLVFVAAAALAYGGFLGVAVALLGAIVSVTVSFVVVRRLGGQPLEVLETSWVRRFLDNLDERPIVTVAVLRLLFWMAPVLNYGLAMTGVRLRDYVVGSALGLIPPVTVSVLLFDWFLLA